MESPSSSVSGSPCSINRRSTKRHDYTFKKSLPLTIRKDINKAVRRTDVTGKEHSLTLCRVKNTDEIFVSSQAVGDEYQTDTKPCSRKDGDTEQIGDLHTHPTNDSAVIGITPSTADIVSTLTDSVKKQIPQISCITGPGAKHIHCYQPKPQTMFNKQKVDGYKNALQYKENSVTDVDPFLRDNVRMDFDHAVYDRKTLKRINQPSPKEVVNDAFLKSKKYIKFDDVPEHLRAGYCRLIEDLNYPDHSHGVEAECRRQLMAGYYHRDFRRQRAQ